VVIDHRDVVWQVSLSSNQLLKEKSGETQCAHRAWHF
jgi:hypothetical protein